MTIYLKQSTASQEILIGMMIDNTDGTTAKTGLTIANTDIQIWKAGATTMANKTSGGATEIGTTGYYYAVLDATDTATLGSMIINVNVAGALMWRGEFVVITANWYDTMFSTDALQVDLIQINGAAQTATLDTIKAETVLIVEDTGTTIPGTITTIDGIVDAILVDTAVIGALGAGLTGIPWNAAWDAEVQSECADALAAYDPPTNAEMEARTIAAANYATAAALATVDGIVDDILVDTGTTIPATITTIDDFLDTEIAAILEDTNELQTDWHDGGRLDLILDAASAPSAATVADAVWDEVLSGHAGAGSAGAALSTASTGGVDAGTLADAVWDEVINTGHSTANSAGKILYDNLNAPVGTVDTVVDGIATQIGTAGAGLSAVPWNASWDAEIQSECTDALNAYDPPTNTEFEARSLPSADYVVVTDTIAGVTLCGTCTTNTDMRGTDSAALASVCTETRLGQLDEANMPTDLDNVFDDVGDVKAVVDEILADTGTTLPATLDTIDNFLDTEVAAILADTNELQTDLTNGGRLDLLIDAILEDTGTTLPATLATINTRTYQNYKISSPVFSVTGKMTSCTVTRYPTKTDADAGTNGIAYAVTATYDGDDNLATYNEVASA